MLDLDRRPRLWTAYAIVGLTLLAPALGGSTTLWAQAAIGLATALLFILSPPRRSLGFAFNTIFLVIGAAALVGFLPALWFPTPEWRTTLLKLGVVLPGTWSPQPWLTMESTFVLWLGLAWAYYLFAYKWQPALREKAWDAFCLGTLCLAATLAICFAINKHVPFWPDVKEFGFFPNRNQTSNVLGLAGIMMYANAFWHLQQGRKQGWLWVAGLALICWALILNFSRSGIILFFTGTLIWHVLWLRTLRRGASRAIAWIPLAIMVALLLLAGGTTLMRFRTESADLFSLSQNGRISIHRDAFQFLKRSPVLGIGLGNFRSLFSAHRQFYLSSSEAIHPESDWLWVATELGCLVPIALLAGIAIWLRRCFPLASGTWRGLRVAAIICGIGFAVHGIFDVSGHRVGSLWPALFLVSTALNPDMPTRPSAAIAVIFRILGVVFAAIGIWWLLSIAGPRTWPTTATVDRLTTQIEAAAAGEQYDQVIGLAAQGLTIAPLNWNLYYERGVAEAALYRPRAEALRDFAAARYLLPNWPDLYLKEGIVWLSAAQPDLAFDVWEEGMRRCGDNAPDLYSQIFGAIKDDPDSRDRWRQLGLSNRKCFLIFLQNAEPVETRIELERVFSEDPQLHTFNQLETKALFHSWYLRGDKLALAQTLQDHPEWQKIAWAELARAYADYQDYRPACETAMRFLTPPDLPEIDPRQSIEALVTRFRVNRDSGNDGFVLATAQFKSGALDNALSTISIASTAKRAPRSLHYIEAKIWADKQNWPKAWQAIGQYDDELR